MSDRQHFMYPDATAAAQTEVLRARFERWAVDHFGVVAPDRTCWAGYRWNTYVDGAYFDADLQTAWQSWKACAEQLALMVQGEVQAVLADLLRPAAVAPVAKPAAERPPKVLGEDGYCVGCTCQDEELDPCLWADAAYRERLARTK
jgi:hypothetical protein